MSIILLIALLIIPMSARSQTVYFRADAENGTVKPPWNSVDGNVTSSTDMAYSGSRSYKRDVDPAVYHRANSSVFPSKPQAYYSSWYYIDQGYGDTLWRNNFEWKTANGPPATIKGGPKIIAGFQIIHGVRQVQLNIVDCNVAGSIIAGMGYAASFSGTGACKIQQRNPLPIPKKQWFHIEAYLKASKTDGHIIMWQDGVEIFNISHPNLDTLTRRAQSNLSKRSDNIYVYWLVNNYVNPNATGRQLLYTDDAIISDYQVSARAGGSLAAPKNLTVTDVTK